MMLLLETSFHRGLFRPSVTTVSNRTIEQNSLPVFLQLTHDITGTMKEKPLSFSTFVQLKDRGHNNINDNKYMIDLHIIINKVTSLSPEDEFY